jgi:hypothetical protein
MDRLSDTSWDRALWALAGIGLVLNGAFVFIVLSRPGAIADAWSDPVAALFMLEALVLLVALTCFLLRWGVTRLHWAWFVVLSIRGSLAFAVPVTLLWERKSEPRVESR